jgi:hypothetical protein
MVADQYYPIEDKELIEIVSPNKLKYCQNCEDYSESEQKDLIDHPINEDSFSIELGDDNVNYTTLKGIRFLPSANQKRVHLFSTQPINHSTIKVENTGFKKRVGGIEKLFKEYYKC